jgi:two-component system, LytTR family, response regulator LytT
MKLLIVEDEQPIRAELCELLTRLEPCELHQAGDGDEALALLSSQVFDAVFLDVQLPGRGGLAVAARLSAMPQPPLLVFATALESHALSAFEQGAVDYLLKPYREARVARTLERLRGRLDGQHLRPALPEPVHSGKLWAIRDGEVSVLLGHHEIIYFEADARRVHAVTVRGETLLVRATLRELEASLALHFARTHKRFLVNIEHLREAEPYFSGTYVLRVGEVGKKVPLSRQFARSLRERTGWF